MIPIPVEDVLPKLLRKALSEDSSGQAFVDWWNDNYQELVNEILELYYLKLPERIPSMLLDILGEMLSAGILQGDSDFTKRYKILKAVQTHKIRGSWTNDAKNRIDSITGYSAVIFSAGDNDDCIEMSQQASDPDFYWSTESGYDGSDDELGTWEVGDFTEYAISGIIYINCHEGIYVSALTADEIAQIVLNLATDIAPAYMKIYLGYVNSAGQFIKYSGGVIE
jgi:hypothetical protein